MINFLLFFVIIGLALLAFFVIGVLRLFGSFFRIGRKRSTDPSQNEEPTNSKSHEKIFKQSEGEYVDYEEVD